MYFPKPILEALLVADGEVGLRGGVALRRALDGQPDEIFSPPRQPRPPSALLRCTGFLK
jgi:hypothetical protein